MTTAPLTWRNQNLHISTLMIPRMGLAHEVLRDWANEMVMDTYGRCSPLPWICVHTHCSTCRWVCSHVVQMSVQLGAVPQNWCGAATFAASSVGKRNLDLIDPNIGPNHFVTEHLHGGPKGCSSACCSGGRASPGCWRRRLRSASGTSLCCFSKRVDFMLGLPHYVPREETRALRQWTHEPTHCHAPSESLTSWARSLSGKEANAHPFQPTVCLGLGQRRPCFPKVFFAACSQKLRSANHETTKRARMISCTWGNKENISSVLHCARNMLMWA